MVNIKSGPGCTYIEVEDEHQTGVVQLGWRPQAELLCIALRMGVHVVTYRYRICRTFYSFYVLFYS